MPSLWWSEYCRNSNGYFGCEESVTEDGVISAVRKTPGLPVALTQQCDVSLAATPSADLTLCSRELGSHYGEACHR